jgi:hypothetical protein
MKKIRRHSGDACRLNLSRCYCRYLQRIWSKRIPEAELDGYQGDERLCDAAASRI